jgi:hypothetical protein
VIVVPFAPTYQQEQMMDMELLNLCDQVFTAGAKAMIEEALNHQLDETFTCPVTGRRWAAKDANKAERIICKARLAQVWWTFTSPDWSLPVLPVHKAEITRAMEAERHDDPFTDTLVGSFARSLAHADYDFNTHPGIDDWIRNFLSLRPDMRRELSHLGLTPKPMPGFNRQRNIWAPPPNGRIETGLARR